LLNSAANQWKTLKNLDAEIASGKHDLADSFLAFRVTSRITNKSKVTRLSLHPVLANR
jgi:hypothetical protein